MKNYDITLIPGDGIGPEVSAAAAYCLNQVGARHGFQIQWDRQNPGNNASETERPLLWDMTLRSIERNKIGLKGPLNTPQGGGYRSINVELRKHFDLYACIRPCVYRPGVTSRITNPENINITVFRENTEDLYAGIEFERDKSNTDEVIHELNNWREPGAQEIPVDAGLSIKYFTPRATARITRFAFDYAIHKGKTRITATTKDNIQKYTDGLFHRVAEETAKLYAAKHPQITFDHLIVDNMTQQLTMRPERFQIILAPNLYGDILSDTCAGLVGGLGVAPGANIGDKYAIFEATHGTAPDIAGQAKANPTAMILSGAMMLEYLGEKDAATELEAAVNTVLAEGTHVTGDLNSKTPVTTMEMAFAISDSLK